MRILGSMLAILTVLVGSFVSNPTATLAREQEKTIELVIDYDDGVETRFSAIPWREGMTVFDAMSAARKRRRGLMFEHVGRGQSLFVRSIDDLPNEGAGEGKRNWIYKINGKTGRKGCGVQTLEASDRVTWVYSTSGLKP